jgi:DNA uptake protein ComE-like DNA-binding protein
VVAPAPAPAPVVAPAPAPPPKPPPVPKALVVDEVPFTPEEAARTVEWLNSATIPEIEAAGVYDKGVGLILNGRPFSDIESFGAIKGIGTKTVEAAKKAGGSP